MKQLNILIILLLSFNVSLADSIPVEDVDDLNVVYKSILSENPANASTLIIFDIDDTLLEAKNFVGSGKWYNWQRGREVFDADGKLVGIEDKNKFMCMFGTLGTLFELGTTKLTQADAAEIVNKLKIYDLMILTARTYGFRSATERELLNNGIDVTDKHLLAPETGLEFAIDKNKPTAKITYKNGIVMSSGQNKGHVLTAILERLNKTYRHIYFIDDSQKNIDNMVQEWKESKSKVSIFHYTKIDQSISQKEVEQSIAAKQIFDKFLNLTYPDRYQSFLQGQCN